MRVFIAGKGTISAIGNNCTESWEALHSLRSGIGRITILPTIYADALPAGEIKLSNQELADAAGMDACTSRTALISAIAAKEALRDSGIDIKKYRTGFISANTVGGMDKTEIVYSKYLEKKTDTQLTGVVHHDSGSITELVADVLGINDFVSTISTACSSSANSMMYGARLIKSNLLDVVIAGGVDSMSRFTISGFNALMILDNKPCVPCDENRNGLNLGEGAGYVVLVSERVAKDLGKNLNIILSGYANANDAFHQTASSPDGKGNFLAMTGALKMSALQPSQINYINLHGTGTKNNDLAEGLAVQKVFEKVPHCSSTKCYTGHTLGASAGVEAVYSLLSMEHSTIIPNLRFETQMKELNFAPSTSLIENIELNHMLSNSFGFGGNCSSLIFSKTSSI